MRDVIPAAWQAPGDLPLSRLDALRSATAPWSKDALCREHPEVNFYPVRGESSAPAKAVCRECLVKRECLVFAMSNRDAFEHGVWGGTVPGERRELLRGHESRGLAPERRDPSTAPAVTTSSRLVGSDCAAIAAAKSPSWSGFDPHRIRERVSKTAEPRLGGGTPAPTATRRSAFQGPGPSRFRARSAAALTEALLTGASRATH